MEQQLGAMISDLQRAKKDLKRDGGFYPAKPRGGVGAPFDGTDGGRMVSFVAKAPSTGRSRLRAASRPQAAQKELAKASDVEPRISRAPASRGGRSCGGSIPTFSGTDGGAMFTGGELLPAQYSGGVLLPPEVSEGGARKKVANPWLTHVAKVRAAHPELSYKDALVAAKSSYRK